MRTRNILLLLCFLISTSYAQLTVNEIVKKALDQDESLRQKRQGYEYDLIVVTKKLDRDENEVIETQKSHAVVHPDKQISVELDGDDSNEKRVKESQKIMAVMDLKKLAPRFNLSLEKDAVVNGKDCYVVKFTPKEDQPYDSREEKVVNALEGKFYIAKDDFSIVRSEGKLTEPISVAWVFATMREVHFQYDAAPLPSGEWGPSRFEMLYDLQAGFAYRRRLQVSTMENYRARPVAQHSVAAAR